MWFRERNYLKHMIWCDRHYWLLSSNEEEVIWLPYQSRTMNCFPKQKITGLEMYWGAKIGECGTCLPVRGVHWSCVQCWQCWWSSLQCWGITYLQGGCCSVGRSYFLSSSLYSSGMFQDFLLAEGASPGHSSSSSLAIKIIKKSGKKRALGSFQGWVLVSLQASCRGWEFFHIPLRWLPP